MERLALMDSAREGTIEQTDYATQAGRVGHGGGTQGSGERNMGEVSVGAMGPSQAASSHPTSVQDILREGDDLLSLGSGAKRGLARAGNVHGQGVWLGFRDGIPHSNNRKHQNNSLAAETADGLGYGAAFTPEMEEEVLENCEGSCMICATNAPDGLGYGAAFTPEMEEEVLENCEGSCMICATNAPDGLGYGAAFTPEMEEEVLANCEGSCMICATNAPACDYGQDDADYTVTVLGTPYNCSAVLGFLGSIGVTNCSLAAETADGLGYGAAFTPEMEEEVLANCEGSCMICATNSPDAPDAPDSPPPVVYDPGTCNAQCDSLENNRCNCTEIGCAFSYDDVCFTDQEFSVASDEVVMVTESHATRIIEGWEKLWLDEISDLTKQFEHIDVTYIASRSLEDMLQEASGAQITLISIGYMLVVVYIIAYFALDMSTGSPKLALATTPGPVASFLAVVCIGLSTFAALGIAGLLVSCGIMFNALTLQILPFLSLGLGINDFFLLSSSVGAVMRAEPDLSAEEIMSRAMAIGGVSITLSSLGNACAFFLAALSPLPAVRHFAIQVAISVLCNYLIAVTVQPAILAVDVARVLRRNSPPISLPSLKNRRSDADIEKPPTESAAPIRTEEKETVAGKVPVTLNPTYSRKSADFDLTDENNTVQTKESRPHALLLVIFDDNTLSLILRLGILVCYAIFFGVSIWGISKVDSGLKLKDVVPEGTYVHNYAVDSEKFESYAVYTVGKDIDYANQMQNIFDLEYDFVHEGKYTNRHYNRTSPWNYYEQYTSAGYCQGSVCDTEVQWVYSKYKADRDQCLSDGSVKLSNEKCRAICGVDNPASPDAYCPQNPLNSAQRCVFTEPVNGENNTASCHCPYVVLPKPELFYSELEKFLQSGVQGEIAESLLSFDDDRNLVGSEVIYFVINIGALDAKLDHIRKARDITADNPSSGDSGREMFPFDISVYALNEQYLTIKYDMFFVLAMGIIAAACIMSILLVHPLTLLITLIVIVWIEVELWGFITFLGMKLNGVVMVNMVMSIGLAIEFTAHVARAFMLAQGSRCTRVRAAIDHMFGPVSNGAITTFLGICAIGMSDYEYFRKYFFVHYTFFLVVCYVNGMVILPILLSFFGPPALELNSDVADSTPSDIEIQMSSQSEPPAPTREVHTASPMMMMANSTE
ncbi:hypothetical protein CYMTET_27739 [Cymbomonas tetramitiformis]|uniref:SSD domain-containing protein n=1 Tax=Cymbomonas tetramitiformis TaxID=36881 RepID=A0AAE0FPG1_9CHLO|nr:hypothetical protein CYMTET_27739 [Cymbomonas tetramitiformis]